MASRNVKERILGEVEIALSQVEQFESEDKKGADGGDAAGPTGTHSLCQNLDFALLHGLRKLHLGYWSFAREFSHKSLVETVENLPSVVTQIGKGRAWLYLSLNDKLFGSYLQSFKNNSDIIKKYYLPTAVLRDKQLWETLVGLAERLDRLDFDLEADSNFLDVGLFTRQLRSESMSQMSEISEVSSPGDSGVAFLDSDQEVISKTDEVDSRHEVQDNRINSLLVLRTLDAKPRLRRRRVSFGNRHSWCVGDAVPTHPPASLPPPTPLANLVAKLGERGIPEGQEDPPPPKKPMKKLVRGGMKLDTSVYIPGVSVQSWMDPDVDEEIRVGALDTHVGREVKPSRRVTAWLRHDLKEEIYKTYVGSCGHSSGKPKLVLAILGMHRVYFVGVEEKKGMRRGGGFRVCFSLPYLALDFVVLGPSLEWVCLVGRDHHDRFQLDTRDQLTTMAIAGHLELATRRVLPWPTHPLSLPSVVQTSAAKIMDDLHRIADLESDKGEESLLLYHGLVYMEDVQTSPPMTPLGPIKDGHLMVRQQGGIWDPVYVILKAGVLYQFESQSNPMPKVLTPLFSHDCHGCRRLSDSAAGRPHAFELVWKGGGHQFAAADEYDASEWLQAFVQAMEAGAGLGAGDMSRGPPPTACCLALVPDRIVAYQTGDCPPTLIAMAGVGSVTRVAMHKRQCCLLEVECAEAHQRSGDWILYFAMPGELRRFMGALKGAWEDVFQGLTLPVGELEKSRLADRCEEKFWLLSHLWEEMLEEPISFS